MSQKTLDGKTRSPASAPIQPGVAGFFPRRLRPFLEIGKEAGLDVAAILEKHGSSESEMLDRDARLPRSVCVAIMKDIFRKIRDPLIGLRAAERATADDSDVVGYIAMQYSNIFSALEAAARYLPLVGDASRLNIVRRDGRVILKYWIEGYPSQLPELNDYAIASIHFGISRFIGAPIIPIKVELTRPKPLDLEPYRVFFGTTVFFGRKFSVLEYPESRLLTPTRKGDDRLAQILSRHADSQLALLGQTDDLCQQIRMRLRHQLANGLMGFSELARSLGIGERTLRRRLKAADTSYQSLLEEVRRQLSFELLDSTTLNIEEIAERLGFSGSAAFRRAFRRWVGKSPSSYQRNAKNKSAPHTPKPT